MTDIRLHEQFAAPGQQRSADFLGMFIFLGTEIMLFGGLFAVAAAYRILEPGAAAGAAAHLKLWLGTANTVVLLTSSLTMALAVVAARGGLRRRATIWLLATVGLGLVFLAIKGAEYGLEFREGLIPPPSEGLGGGEQLFINLYLVATGLHAIHLVIGVVMVAGMAGALAARRLPLPGKAITIEMAGLYWHLVDVVWIFLFPVLYLAR